MLGVLLLAGCGATVQVGGPPGSSGFPAGGGAEHTDSMTTNHPGVARLAADVDSGDLIVAPGPDGSSMVTAVRNWSGDAPPQVTEVVEGDTLRITARCPDRTDGRCSVVLTVTLPAAAAVQGEVAAGDIRVEGLAGAQDLTSAAGDVTATGLRATDVRARSSAGDVKLTFAAAPRTVDAESAAGDIAVRLPSGDAYRIVTSVTVGDATVTVPNDPRADRSVSARTSAGDVTISAG